MAERTCARCGVDIEHRDKRSRHCSPLCRNRDYENATVGTVRNCAHCRVEFSPSKGTHKFCTKVCRDRADVVRNRSEYNRRNAERRARERGAQVGESFTREEIFDRDGWICQLCLTPINWNLTGRQQRAAALDHIVPLKHGGKHTRENVWAAHSGCNARKRDRQDVLVLPVVGCA